MLKCKPGGRSPEGSTYHGQHKEDEIDEIVIARGRVKTPAYSGPVTLGIDKEYRGLLDLRVYHDIDASFHPLKYVLADDPAFAYAVVGLLKERGRLDADASHELHRAELGMQEPDMAVFECLYEGGRRIDREAALRWGAEDREEETKAEIRRLFHPPRPAGNGWWVLKKRFNPPRQR